jgi:transketolase
MNKISCREIFTVTLLDLARKDRNIIAVTSDARGSVTLNRFAMELPEQFVEIGIAEQNAIGISAGLASCGKNVFLCGPACFYTARSLEQIKVDVAYSKNPVKIIGVSGGVSYGALGSTHHSLHDLAVMKTFPGLNVFMPCDNEQTRQMTVFLSSFNHPVYVRMGRGPVPEVYEPGQECFKPGKANILMDGNDITLIGTGETVYHCLQGANLLKKYGIGARVIDMYTMKPLDKEALLNAARETGYIVTVEEHSIYGGLGAAVAEIVSQEYPVPLKIIGFPDENVIHASPEQIFKNYGISAEYIADTARNLLSNFKKQII